MAAALATAVLPGPAAEAAPAVAPAPGGSSSGDTLFPRQGNTGYDVQHYGIAIDASRGRSITAKATLSAYAPAALSSFTLDLEGLTVTAVEVDGRAARFSRTAAKLVVVPARAVQGRFSVRVRYHGVPVVHTDPDKSKEGWLPTSDGSTALNEPVGAMTWFPVNNRIADKATFTYAITARSSRAVAANGNLVSRHRHGSTTRWTWRLRQPISPYLSMVSIGKYRVHRGTIRSIDGRRIKVWTFVQPGLGTLAKQRRLLPQILRFEERRYGPYPFSSTGIVVHRLAVGYALETATRPFFPNAPGTSVLVHEQAHQWFGDTITPCDWGGIWLNEGFATYAEWQWSGAHGGSTPAQSFARLYAANPAKSTLWSPAPAAPKDPADLFADPVYTRGAMTLEVLRQRVGSAAFAKIVTAWTAQSRNRCVTTPQFVALAERVSGQQLDTLFHDWLYVAKRPVGYGAEAAEVPAGSGGARRPAAR